MNTLILVGCSSGKRDRRAYVWDLYEGDYFAKRMTVAMLAGTPAVLSAEHGYLPVTERIDPYDTNLKEDLSAEERDEWGEEVANSIPERFDRVMFLAGKEYRNNVQNHLSDDFEVIDPFACDELRGIGDQIGWLKEAAERLEQGETLEEVLPE